MRKGNEAVHRAALGEGAGVAHLYFDRAHGLLYSAGRGDMQIGIYQQHSSLPGGLKFLQNILSSSPTKGFSLLPKWALDPNKHEVDRGVHMTNDKTIIYRSFTLANRTGLFQPELYPPFDDNIPNNDYKSWAAGKDEPAKIRQLSDKEFKRRETVSMAGVLAGLTKDAAAAMSSDEDEETEELREELAQLKKELQEINMQNASA